MKDKKNIIIFIIILIISSTIFYSFLNMHYATDTYNIIDRGYNEYATKYSLNDGRVIMGIITLASGKINLPIQAYVITLTFLAILTSCVSVMLLKKIFSAYKNPRNIFEEIILTLICYSIIWNFMFLENMQFAECFVMSLSILCYILASNVFMQKQKYYFLKSLILVILGIISYQGTLGFFVVMVLVITLIEDNKKIIKNITLSGLICVLACIINFIQMKIFSNAIGLKQRINHFEKINQAIPFLIKQIPDILKNTAGIFPKNLFIIFLGSTILLSIVFVKEHRLKWMLKLILLTIITIGATFAINIFTLAGFKTARMMFCLGALIGIIHVLVYTNTDIIEKKNVFMINILVIYVISIIITYNYIINKHKQVEVFTKQECATIGTYIKEYEKSSGNTLTKIAVYKDTSPTYFYSSIDNYSALCIRPLSVEWGDNGAINYYCNTKLKEIEPSEEVFEEYFKDKDWNEINQEQFVFIDDVLHYCIY